MRQLTLNWSFNCATPEAESAARVMFEKMVAQTYSETYGTLEPAKQLRSEGEYFGTVNQISINAHGTYEKNGSNLNDWIYVYYIRDGLLIFDRSVSRTGLGPSRADELVKEHRARGYEAFYTIGTLTRTPALS